MSDFKNKVLSKLNEAVDKQEQLLMNAVNDAITAFKSGRRYASRDDIQDAEMQGTWCYGGVRHWGSWEVPEGEEDDGDYDWEKLTPKSRKEADALVKKVQAKHKKVDLKWSTEEKNWISFQARVKK